MVCSKCGAENPERAKFCSKCGAELGTPAKPSETVPKPEPESSTGMSANVAGLLCYVLGWITGIVFVVLEKKSTFVKFHAWQSIMTFGVLFVLWLIVSRVPVVGWIVGTLMLVLWIILLIQAASGRVWKLPLAGDWAEKQAKRQGS
jgi:uncharacterized membrane protein